MKYMNVVKFTVKPDRVDALMAAFETQPDWQGQIEARTIQTGENAYCACGLWESKESMDAAMSSMVQWLDTVRDLLVEISPEMGVTDACSGPVVIEK